MSQEGRAAANFRCFERQQEVTQALHLKDCAQVGLQHRSPAYACVLNCKVTQKVHCFLD